MLNLPLPSDHGWYHYGSIKWVQEQFPDDVSFLLLNDKEMVFDDSDSDWDNDDKKDQFYRTKTWKNTITYCILFLHIVTF